MTARLRAAVVGMVVIAASVASCSSDAPEKVAETLTTDTQFAATTEGAVQCWLPDAAIDDAFDAAAVSVPGPVYVYPDGPGEGEPLQLDGCNYTIGSGTDLILISSGQTADSSLFDDASTRDSDQDLGQSWHGARDGFAYSLSGGGTRWLVVSGASIAANDERLIALLDAYLGATATSVADTATG